MFNQNGGYSLADIAAATGVRNGNGDGMFGDNGWWIILLFLFAGWGGNGFGWGGGNGGGAGSVKEEIAYGFDMNGLENGVRGIQQGLCDGFYAMNTGMLNGFAGVNAAITANGNALNATMVADTNAITGQLHDMAAANAACCCETGRTIERGFADLGYTLATQSCDTRRTITDATRDIIDNNNAGVRSILDF